MKSISVVGAGFAGLAAAFYLADHFRVTVFDQKGIGGGASGISSGLLHPYPGEKGRQSWHANEALGVAKELIDIAENHLGMPVAHRGGILRLGPCQSEGDSEVIPLGDEMFWIRSGMTVFPELYLDGLWKACQAKGVQLEIQTISKLEGLTILAVGAGIFHFPECHHLKLNFVKGQILTCRLEKPLERSISAKRYTALTSQAGICHVGATYERDFSDDQPCLSTAVALLKPDTEVLDCRAGVRVTNPAHYFPIVEQVTPTTWVITALGSRGLLYHAYLAKQVVNKICGR